MHGETKPPKEYEPTPEETRAALFQCWQSSFPLVNLTRPAEGGSGVGVQIGKRFFLATAAHIIKEGDEFLIPRVSAQETCIRDCDFVSRHRNFDADVGLLEIDPRKALQIRNRFLSTDRLLPHFPHERKLRVVIMGYSADCIAVDHREGMLPQVEWVDQSYAMMAFGSEIVPLSEWPSEEVDRPLDRPFNSERDILLSFGEVPFVTLEKPDRQISGPLKPPSGTPTLKGCSGGGIWFLVSFSSPIWRPCGQLIGLQVDYKPGSGWARGTSVGVWVDLVAEKYPDLREEMASIRQKGVESIRLIAE